MKQNAGGGTDGGEQRTRGWQKKAETKVPRVPGRRLSVLSNFFLVVMPRPEDFSSGNGKRDPQSENPRRLSRAHSYNYVARKRAGEIK